MCQTVFEPNRGETLCRLFEGIPAAGEFQRYGDVLKCGHGRHKMECLEQNSYMVTTEKG